MEATIPCINPAHRVKFHVPGTAAGAACERTVGTASRPHVTSVVPSSSAVTTQESEPERESVPKAQALRELRSSKSVTLTGFRQKDFRTGKMEPAKHLFAGVKRKVITGGAEDTVRFDDDSSLYLDKGHRCYRGDDGELIVQGVDEDDEPWVELTYSVKQ